jgi:ribonuclease Z
MIRLVFLGVGGGAPSRWGLPGILVFREGLSILFDCGEGTQQRIMEKALGINVKVVAITHMHGDHVLGLPGMIQTMGLLGRKEELIVLGPGELKDFLEETFRRTKFEPDFPITFADKFETKEFSLRPFETCHTIESRGYVLEEAERRNLDADRLRAEGIKEFWVFRALKEGKTVEYKGRVLKPEDYVRVSKGKKVVYTGDTRPCDKVIEASKDADLLIHDSTFDYNEEAHAYGHSNAGDAGEIAAKANVRTLALYHYSARYSTTEPLLTEARRKFPRVVAPEPFDSIFIR